MIMPRAKEEAWVQRGRVFAPILAGMRVLVVEDDVALAKSMVGLLEETGAVVVHAVDAAGAEAALAGEGFGLVVSDYSLGPGPKGDEVLKAAKALQPGARRIMMSGSKEAIWVVEVGLADTFMLKTGRMAGELFNAVEELMSKQGPEV
jgi:DNA-binding NtrC family response regulator